MKIETIKLIESLDEATTLEQCEDNYRNMF